MPGRRDPLLEGLRAIELILPKPRQGSIGEEAFQSPSQGDWNRLSFCIEFLLYYHKYTHRCSRTLVFLSEHYYYPNQFHFTLPSQICIWCLFLTNILRYEFTPISTTGVISFHFVSPNTYNTKIILTLSTLFSSFTASLLILTRSIFLRLPVFLANLTIKINYTKNISFVYIFSESHYRVARNKNFFNDFDVYVLVRVGRNLNSELKLSVIISLQTTSECRPSMNGTQNKFVLNICIVLLEIMSILYTFVNYGEYCHG